MARAGKTFFFVMYIYHDVETLMKIDHHLKASLSVDIAQNLSIVVDQLVQITDNSR